jgi:hypothetical protein
MEQRIGKIIILAEINDHVLQDFLTIITTRTCKYEWLYFLEILFHYFALIFQEKKG